MRGLGLLSSEKDQAKIHWILNTNRKGKKTLRALNTYETSTKLTQQASAPIITYPKENIHPN